MKIVLKTLLGKRTKMEVESSDTIAALKVRIEATQGISSRHQRLIFAGMVLEDSHTLDQYNVQKGSVLHLLQSLTKTAEGSGPGSSRIHDEFTTVEWWEIFALCANEVYTRSTYYDGFDEDVINQYLSLLHKSDLSYVQQVAFDGLKVQLGQVSARRSKRGSYSVELEKGLKTAIRAYEVAVKSGTSMGPFIIHESIPFPVFDAWYERQENHWKIAFQFTDSTGGVVLLYGDPSFLHEGVTQWFNTCLVAEAAIIGGYCITECIQLLGSSRIVLPTVHKEPDFAVQPVRSKHKVPPFIGEIAYANESLDVLQGELVQWTLAGGAEIAYGVKISLKNGVAGKSEVKLRFLERRKGDDFFLKNLDFSPDMCLSAEDPYFVIEFPLALVFQGASTDERLLNGVARFNLFHLQQRVLELLENREVDFVWHPKRKARTDEGSSLITRVKDTKEGLLKRFNSFFK